MGINSRYLSKDGRAKCISCRKIKELSELADQCESCGRWVCKECAVYRRQGNPFGYMCKKCAKENN